MEKTPIIPPTRFRSAFPWAMNFLFYGSLCWTIALSELPSLDLSAFALRKLLFSGHEAIFRIPGAEFLIFRPYLPTKGTVSFIKDTPHQPSDPKTEWLYLAQRQLIPLLLNKNPGEKAAIIFCSNENIAELRMRDTGYHWVKNLGGGKGIAERNP